MFGKIIEILFLRENEVYFLIVRYETIILDPHFNAFCIEVEDADHVLQFIPVSSLGHFKPFSPWTEPNSNSLYISPRHIML